MTDTMRDWTTLKALVREGLPVRADSRRVEPGDAFVAVSGPNADGARFIPQALERGAAWVVAESADGWPSGAGAALVVRPDTRLALGELAALSFGADRPGFLLAGVTGTNGKTTITYLVEHILARAGLPTGVIGTVEYRWRGHTRPAVNTTPGCLTLHSLLAEMTREGCVGAVMEVSSHALDQDRVAGLAFDAAALTNVTQDHLDYHRDMESYFQAKRRLFTTYLRDPSRAVLNFDDACGRRLLREFPQAVGFGLTPYEGPGRKLSGKVLSSTGRGLRMEMAFAGETWQMASPLVGAFNASNLLAAQGLALALGLPVAALGSLADCAGAPGRLERVDNTRGLNVFVDYAHTPDALDNVLRVLRGLDFERVIAVFGCGGDRDRTKRPLMAQAVARWADVAVLTSDNPRHEDPLAIMDDALPGLAGARRTLARQDRREAIAQALEMATPRDAVLIAGKGHEDYQDICGVKHPFHDASIVREILGCA